jgi:hypothetical protein
VRYIATTLRQSIDLFVPDLVDELGRIGGRDLAFLKMHATHQQRPQLSTSIAWAGIDDGGRIDEDEAIGLLVEGHHVDCQRPFLCVVGCYRSH